MLLRDLSWLVTVADRGHVTEAAAVLRTSQPNLSRAIARVEQEVGARLFERTSSGVHPTAAGEVVVRRAREIAALHGQLVADVARLLDPESGEVRLAFLDSMATSLVPSLLRAFHARWPGIRVLLRQEPHHEVVEDVRTGVVDLAVTSGARPGGFGWLPLQEERLVVVVPPTHRLAGRSTVVLSELADEELVTTPVGFGFRALVDGLLAEAGVVPRVSFESQDLATIEGLVAAGLGVGVVPESFAGQSGTTGLRIRQAPGARRTIGLTWREDPALPPPAACFRDFVAGWGHEAEGPVSA